MKKTLITIICTLVLFCSFTARANEPPDSIKWTVSNGGLTMSGSGAMADYANPEDVPWYENRSGITEIVVEDGITHIGNLAFYGLTNALKATVPQSVESIGLCAFSYTEGARTSIGDLSSEYRFSVDSSSSVVSKGDEFTVSINLTADFKDLSVLQSILLFDMDKIAIDENDIFDTAWYESVDESNLGYLSKPLSGIVANNVRIAYISASGSSIDSSSPLYTAGKTTITVAKVKCKALCDIEDVNSSCFYIKSSSVGLSDLSSPKCSEDQLVTVTRLPMKQLVINGKDSAETIYTATNNAGVEKSEKLTVTVNGTVVEYDTDVYADENAVIMIPLRHTMESAGGIVTWDNSSKTAFSIFNGELSAIQIGQNTLFKSSENIVMDAAAVIKGSRTMVPRDYFQKAFGFTVSFDKNTNIISITTK